MLWIIPALYLFFITSQQPILNSKNNFHHLKKNSRWKFLIQIEIYKKMPVWLSISQKKLLSFMKILGNKLLDSEYKIGFYMWLTRHMFWHFLDGILKKIIVLFSLDWGKQLGPQHSTLHCIQSIYLCHIGGHHFSQAVVT